MLNENAHPRGGHCSDVGTPWTRQDELLAALDAIRVPHADSDAARRRAWQTVAAYVTRVLPNRAEDDRQDALLRVFESAHTLRATSGPSAAAWVRLICRNRRVNRHRRRGGRTFVSYEADRTMSLTDTSPLPFELAVVVFAAFIERIDDYLARTEPRTSIRRRRRVHGIVALRRTALQESLPEIAAALGLDVSLTLLTKWVERGRAVIVETVDAEREHDPDAADLFAPFADLALDRRADAGRPRPARRKHNA